MGARPAAALLLLAAPLATALVTITSEVWRGSEKGTFEQPVWPEASLPDLMGRTGNSAISFSGGGSRAFQAAMGQLGGLRNLGVLDNVRYITGTSGGGWATSAFTFHSKSVSDDVFLGAIPAPEDITMDSLAVADPTSARSFTGRFENWIKDDWLDMDDPLALYEAYKRAIWAVFLEPAFVGFDALLNWDDDTEAAVKAASPALANASFASVFNTTQNPYPLINFVALGPLDAVPFWPLDHQHFRVLEATPLAVGLPTHGQVEYTLPDNSTVTLDLGGMVQPHAFGRGAPTMGLAPHRKTGTIKFEETSRSSSSPGFTVAETAGATSWAPGMFFSSVDGVADPQNVNHYIGCDIDYFSPDVAFPEAQTFLFADGGDVMNNYLAGPLMRGVDDLVMFMNFEYELADSSTWDPATEPPTDKTIQEDLCAYFGVAIQGRRNATQTFDDHSWNYQHDQFFPTEDFVPLVQALQARMEAGKGAVTTMTHKTVENAIYNVPAGREVTITWVYLSHAWDWEAALPYEVSSQIGARKSDFEDFPNYNTGNLNLTHSQANLLADMTGWVVQNNADDFARLGL